VFFLLACEAGTIEVKDDDTGDTGDCACDAALEWHVVDYDCGNNEDVTITFDEVPVLTAHLVGYGWTEGAEKWYSLGADDEVTYSIGDTFHVGGAAYCRDEAQISGRFVYAYESDACDCDVAWETFEQSCGADAEPITLDDVPILAQTATSSGDAWSVSDGITGIASGGFPVGDAFDLTASCAGDVETVRATVAYAHESPDAATWSTVDYSCDDAPTVTLDTLPLYTAHALAFLDEDGAEVWERANSVAFAPGTPFALCDEGQSSGRFSYAL
jgi:hypothetical protein